MDHLGESWAVRSPSAEMGMQGARESRRAGVSLPNPGQVWLGSTIHWVNTDGRIPSTGLFVCLFVWPHRAACRILVYQPGLDQGLGQ